MAQPDYLLSYFGLDSNGYRTRTFPYPLRSKRNLLLPDIVSVVTMSTIHNLG